MMVLTTGLGLAQPTQATSPTAVISEVYGGGGNSGATLTNDFIELSNRGQVAASLAGWSVQYASAAGSTWQVTALSGSMAPGQRYLVGEAQGAGGSQPLPTPDASGSIPMSATNGKVALVNSTAALSCSTGCATAPGVVDLVGYGSASSAETAPTPALTNTTSASRNANGCMETDDNSADFTVGSPSPQNSSGPAITCAEQGPVVASRFPAVDGVARPTVVLSVGFSEPVATAPDWLALSCPVSGSPSLTYSGGPTMYEADPAGDLVDGETCTATVVAGRVSDVDTDDPPDTMAADDVWSFTVAAEGTTNPIRSIQGAAHRSPRLGERVQGIAGIVTAVASNGFWMQDPVPDGDAATSEGIFVFTSSGPGVLIGDELSVEGTVAEFRPGSDADNLTTTELSSPAIATLSRGNPLPPSAVVGAAGRVPPGEVIDDDATGNVETSGTFDAATDGIDFWESLEGMRVRVDDAIAVGPRNQFGEIPVVPDQGSGTTLRTPRGGVVIRPEDFNPERTLLDDRLAPTPSVKVGDTFAGPVEGVLDYSFGMFKLLVTSTPQVVAGSLPREEAQPAGPNELHVSTYNVENLDPTDGTARFDAIAAQIVTNLRSPDLLVLEEVQDNNGATNDAITDATLTYQALSQAIVRAGGPTYDWRDIAPQDDQDGGEPGGNIRVGFMFRTDRGLAFVDRPGGTATTDTTVIDTPTGPILSASPGRIKPADGAWAASRKPLVGEFTYGGQRLFVVGNHFKSKIGDQPLFGVHQPPVRSTETQRNRQGELVNAFADQVLASEPNSLVMVAGDHNDFPFSATVAALKGNDLVDLSETLPESERYSYVYEGNSQALDEILVSLPLRDTLVAFDHIHINSEYSSPTSDHDPPAAWFRLRGTGMSVSVSDATVDEGSGPARFTVQLSEPPTLPVIVDYESADVSAQSPSDYESVAGTLTFSVGEQSKTVDVPVTDDAVDESDETFELRLAGQSPNASLGDAIGVGTIVDNDVPPSADLSVTKTGPAGRVPTGRNFTYTVTVRNHGPDPATGVIVTDLLPQSVSFVSAVPSQGSCNESGLTVTCSLGAVGNAATATVEIVVTPNQAGVITNTVLVGSSVADMNPANDSYSLDTSVCRVTSRRSSIPCP